MVWNIMCSFVHITELLGKLNKIGIIDCEDKTTQYNYGFIKLLLGYIAI